MKYFKLTPEQLTEVIKLQDQFKGVVYQSSRRCGKTVLNNEYINMLLNIEVLKDASRRDSN